jgi:hypothetical protein
MSMVSEASRDEESYAGGRRTVAGVVNSVETLEGEGFLAYGNSTGVIYA